MARGSTSPLSMRWMVRGLLHNFNEALLRQVSDREAEIELRRRHYDEVLRRLAEEEKRTLEQVLPPRYSLRGEARVYPIAIEIRLPGATA